MSNPSLEVSLLNVVVDKPELSTRAVSHQTVCREIKENRLHLFHFQQVQALNPTDDLLRLTVGGTEICAIDGLHSFVTQLL
ncbi:hypothetical protein TNCV_1621421 [Trichonephila clavipes]|nr:hypothetical protein TNCV_1621421 [Trichonephila clavipes]